MESILHRLAGSAFHSVGATTLTDLSPSDFLVFPAGCNRIVVDVYLTALWLGKYPPIFTDTAVLVYTTQV